MEALLFPLLLIVPIYALVMHIIALNAAKRGELYQYPLIFRMIGPPEGAEAIDRRSPMSAPTDDYSPEPAAYPNQEPAPASGGGMIWVWLVGGFCLVLLLGCFGSIGAYFIIRASSKKTVALNATSTPEAKDFPAAAGKTMPAAQPANLPNLPNVAPPGLPPIPPRSQKADLVEQALDDMKSADRFVRAAAPTRWRDTNPIIRNEPRSPANWPGYSAIRTSWRATPPGERCPHGQPKIRSPN